MKIAVVAGPYIAVPPPRYGGTEKIIHYLIKGLIEQGHEPILLGPGDSQVECELIPIVKKSIFFPKTTAYKASHDKELTKALKETNIQLRAILSRVDIIHSHGFDLKDFKNFPNVTTIHGPIEMGQLDYYADRPQLNYISVSKDQQDGYPSLNWAGVVYNGEDPLEFSSIKKPNNYVCFVGRFDEQKNPHLAIQLATNYGMKIKIAGKIDFLGDEYFKKEVKPLLKHPLVEYMGELNSAESAQLLAHAKCNLHPTGFREPFGLTVLEAAYGGTPTLAIARGSMPELIEEGHTGMLVEDFVEGFHQLEKCFDMKRSYIARRARLHFNYKNMTKDYLKTYKSVIAKSGK